MTFVRLAEGAGGLALSRGLLHALLEELHISDDFDVLVGRVARQPASQYPRLLAIALLLRHSWCPQDLARTATRLGLSRPGPLRPRHLEQHLATAATAVAQRRVRRSQSPVPAERRSHVERIVLAIRIHTRSPRAGTRLRLPVRCVTTTGASSTSRLWC